MTEEKKLNSTLMRIHKLIVENIHPYVKIKREDIKKR